jgi:hypothetical protein
MPFSFSNADVWSHLTLFTSREVLERRYQSHHGREISAGKAKEIISHLEQGRQYFDSAASAGILAGPLEQYYGVLSFARAIVLFKNPLAREANLKPGHGLKATLQGDDSIDQIEIRIQSGSFDDLLQAIDNSDHAYVTDHGNDATLFLASSMTKRLKQQLPKPAVGQGCIFIELLGRIPALRELYQQSLAERPSCYQAYVSVFSGGQSLRVSFGEAPLGLPPSAELLQTLGFPQDATVAEPQTQYNEQMIVTVHRQVGERTVYDEIPHLGVGQPVGQALIARYPGGWSLNRLATYFMASHVLSSLVRYHPTRWAQLINHERDDRLLPLITELRRLIQTEFVQLVLDELSLVTAS